MRFPPLIVPYLLALTFTASITVGAAPSPEIQLLALRAGDIRVATIGYRLATANAALCDDIGPVTGLVLHDAIQYATDFRPIAIRLFNLVSGPGIMGVVPGSAAALAGLRANDILLAIDGIDVSDEHRPSGRARYDALQLVLDRLDKALATGHATLTILRGDQRVAIDLVPVKGCRSTIQLVPSENINASADGKTVSITTAIADFAASDDELAVVIAHELAHNVRHHRERLDAEGVARGFFGRIGRNALRIRDTERDADYVGLYLMARAGYNIDAAPGFWGRLGRDHGPGIFGDATHPGWRERAREVEAGIAEIRARQKSGESLVPATTSPIVSPR